jgi:hypothetical protein
MVPQVTFGKWTHGWEPAAAGWPHRAGSRCDRHIELALLDPVLHVATGALRRPLELLEVLAFARIEIAQTI